MAVGQAVCGSVDTGRRGIFALLKRTYHLRRFSPSVQRPERGKNARALLDRRRSSAADGDLLVKLRDFRNDDVFLSCRQSADSCGGRGGRVLRSAAAAQDSVDREKRFPVVAIRCWPFPVAPPAKRVYCLY